MLTPALRARILWRRGEQLATGPRTGVAATSLCATRQQRRSASRLEEAGLKPHRLERYMASDDPEFESKDADIFGLYLHPPQHAAVFCVDEKTAIPALDRLDPVLPLSPGRAERHGFAYYRHGALSLICSAPYRHRSRSG